MKQNYHVKYLLHTLLLGFYETKKNIYGDSLLQIKKSIQMKSILIFQRLLKKDPPKISINSHKFIMALLLLLSINLLLFGQVGVQTDNPDPSSALDIVSSDKGILIPRVALTVDLSNPSPVTAPATGLLIFNSGANQESGFYYWNGSTWVGVGGTTSLEGAWLTDGNYLKPSDKNFIGSLDSTDLSLMSNNKERMRINANGQIIFGTDIPVNENDMLSVVTNDQHVYGINSYSDYTGFYTEATNYGLISKVTDSTGFPVYGKNEHAEGYGGMFVGSNGTAYILIDHTSGIASHGDDGIFTTGLNTSSGIGIIAGGNGVETLSTIEEGAGGAFTGYHGIYSHAIDQSEGTGVIGVGNDNPNYYSLREGCGGAFTGFHGILGYATDETDGTGIVGGGNARGYYMMPAGYGSGGAFTGKYYGLAAWADYIDNSTVAVIGQYLGSGGWRDGIGVKGIAYANNGRGYGVYGQGNRYGVYSNGNFGASGSKSFAIDHPLDPANKILKHYSVESPEVLNMYRGNTILDQNGESKISLPDYFNSININYSYVLTPIGAKAPDLFVKQEIDDKGTFQISGGQPGQKISWIVYAERDDAYMRAYPESKTVEVTKEDDLKGLYIRPELYNKSEEQGMFYVPEQSKVLPESKPEVLRQKIADPNLKNQIK